MTAGVLQHEREMAFAAGMNDFLAKPVTMADLKAILDKFVPPHKMPNLMSSTDLGSSSEGDLDRLGSRVCSQRRLEKTAKMRPLLTGGRELTDHERRDVDIKGDYAEANSSGPRIRKSASKKDNEREMMQELVTQMLRQRLSPSHAPQQPGILVYGLIATSFIALLLTTLMLLSHREAYPKTGFQPS